MKSWEKVAICKNWCDCLVYPTVMNSHVTLTINAWRTKTTVGLKAFQLLKFQREDCLRSSSSARIGGKPSLYKGRDGKGWIPLVWLVGYNESLRLNGVVDIGLICLNNDKAVIKLNNWGVDTVMACFYAFCDCLRSHSWRIFTSEQVCLYDGK